MSPPSRSRRDGPRWRVQDAELPGRRRLPVERAVQPVAVVVVDEDAEHALEVAPVHDQEPVEPLGPGRADEALGDCVRRRRPHRRLDGFDPSFMAFLTMRSKRQPVAADGNGFPLVQAILGHLAARTFATRCVPAVPYLFHPNRSKTT